LLSTPVAVEIVPLPSFSEPVQTALALLAIVPPWGSIGFSKIELPDAPRSGLGKPHRNGEQKLDAQEARPDAHGGFPLC
jgi:hypothetical protein